MAQWSQASILAAGWMACRPVCSLLPGAAQRSFPGVGENLACCLLLGAPVEVWNPGLPRERWPVPSLSYSRAWESGDDDKGTVTCTADWSSATKSTGRICKGPLHISEPASASQGCSEWTLRPPQGPVWSNHSSSRRQGPLRWSRGRGTKAPLQSGGTWGWDSEGLGPSWTSRAKRRSRVDWEAFS